MTEIITTSLRPGRAGVRRKKHSVKTDMTPLADLGFLLIAFFIMTTEMAKPSVVKLNMPKEGPQMPVANSNALTVLLGNKDRVYFYQGNWKDALVTNTITETNLTETAGIGKIIREKQRWLQMHDSKEGQNALMLIIKAGKEASYKMVIDALDEALINKVTRYAVLAADTDESRWLSLH